MTRYDAIIIGQGLAGSALAWALRMRGARVAVVDRGNESTPSRVAAGLITPVTGQRMAASWRYRELHHFAASFYREIESRLGTLFYHAREMVRLFLTPTEREAFGNRSGTLLRGLVREPASVNAAHFHCEHGGFEMPDSARLDTTTYLDATRRTLVAAGDFYLGEIEPMADIETTPNGVILSKLGIAASNLIFCQGFEPNALFPSIPFNCVKGEVLTVHVPGLRESRVVHRGVWLVHVVDDQFLAGSTYERERLDSLPTPSGRDSIVSRLRELLRLPFDILDHRAGVRPVLRDGRPLLGMHTALPHIGVFNGLGSKGALLAPYFASQLAEALLHGNMIEPEVSVRRIETGV